MSRSEGAIRASRPDRIPSLRWRVVAAVALLLVVTNVVVGAVTVVAYRGYLIGRLDAELATAAGRTPGGGPPSGAPTGPPPGSSESAQDPENRFIGAPGQAADTVVAILRDGDAVLAGYTDSAGEQHRLTRAQQDRARRRDPRGGPGDGLARRAGCLPGAGGRARRRRVRDGAATRRPPGVDRPARRTHRRRDAARAPGRGVGAGPDGPSRVAAARTRRCGRVGRHRTRSRTWRPRDPGRVAPPTSPRTARSARSAPR